MSHTRYLTQEIRLLCEKKLILLSGPRQVGKTTLAKSLFDEYSYYNYDIKEDFRIFSKNEWDRSAKFLIFDELHKMRKWKSWLKGIVDDGRKARIMVTGSARMDTVKKAGDSLAGRYFSLRLNPLDLKELNALEKKSSKSIAPESLEENYQKLLQFSGFPEPYFEASDVFYGLWKRTHMDIILRQDMLTLENVRDIDAIENLVQLLSERVGSTISMSSLAKDLGRDDKTVAKWIQILESLFVVFKVTPYAKNIALGIKKATKIYFYDLARVQGDESQKLENLVALSLKKEIEFLQDTQGLEQSLHFTRDRNHREIDFLIHRKKSKSILIEVKMSDEEPSKNFSVFEKYFPECEKIQLVRHLRREYLSKNSVSVQNALLFLAQVDLDYR